MPDAKAIPLVVLQVTPALDAGGVERTTVDVARAIVAAGGTALIATSGGRLVAEAERAGARVIIGPYDTKNPLTVWRNAARLGAIVDAERVAIIHARSRAPAWSALWAARRKRKSFVTTYHGIYKAGNALKRVYNAVMAKGDIVIANSQFTAAHILAEHKIDPAKLVTIPRGIDIDIFTPSRVTPERIATLRAQWNLVAGLPVILLPGRLTRLKGHTTFLNALAKLPHRRFIAVLAGGGEDRDRYVDKLKQQIERLGLAPNVRMPGHVGDLAAAYMLADIVVSPSTVPESFGRTPVEAQAMGRPLIATALGGQLETVEDSVTGFRVPAFDAAALAEAIDHALALDKTSRDTMASVGRNRVVERYTVDAMCAATLDVYKQVLARHG